jgi:hypothetical protein
LKKSKIHQASALRQENDSSDVSSFRFELHTQLPRPPTRRDIERQDDRLMLEEELHERAFAEARLVSNPAVPRARFHELTDARFNLRHLFPAVRSLGPTLPTLTLSPWQKKLELQKLEKNDKFLLIFFKEANVSKGSVDFFFRGVTSGKLDLPTTFKSHDHMMANVIQDSGFAKINLKELFPVMLLHNCLKICNRCIHDVSCKNYFFVCFFACVCALHGLLVVIYSISFS